MTNVAVGTDAGRVLQLFRARGELSRTDVMQLSGLSRSTINHRLTALTDKGLLRPVQGGESTGGRPSSRFAFNAQRAAVLTVDIGASGFLAAICDLEGEPVAHAARRVDVWSGPQVVLSAVEQVFTALLDEHPVEVWGIGVGVPGPVEYAAHQVISPPIMTGWDRFDIAGWFEARHGCPVVVENDANARAIAEARASGLDNLICLKIGTGIGSGLVFNGSIIRGHQGAAGDVGHTRATSDDAARSVECRCGNTGCVEALAGGWAIVRDLDERGVDVHDVTDVVRLCTTGDLETNRLVRRAGRVIGDAVATLVGTLNPRRVVISGQLADCGEVLLSGIRERVYQRVLPLATQELEITVSALGRFAGVGGLATSTADHLLSTEAIERLLVEA